MSTSIFIEQLAAGHAADAKETLSNLLSARAFEALDERKQELASTLFGGQVEEEVEELDEGTMTGITLGAKVKNKQGGYNQDVHHKGEKIGHIEAYKHRTGGMRYGSHHDASGDGSAGNRDAEESIADIRFSHAQHLKDNRVKKEEVKLKEEKESEHYKAGHDYASDHAQDSGFKATARARKKEMLADNPHKKGTKEHSDWHRGANDGHQMGLDNM